MDSQEYFFNISQYAQKKKVIKDLPEEIPIFRELTLT